MYPLIQIKMKQFRIQILPTKIKIIVNNNKFKKNQIKEKKKEKIKDFKSFKISINQ